MLTIILIKNKYMNYIFIRVLKIISIWGKNTKKQINKKKQNKTKNKTKPQLFYISKMTIERDWLNTNLNTHNYISKLHKVIHHGSKNMQFNSIFFF